MKKNTGFIAMIFLALGFSDQGQASASASLIKKFQKRSIVAISAGKLEGYGVGKRVCFFSTTGRNLGCGEIVKASLKKSRDKVPRPLFQRLEKGFDAKLQKGGIQDTGKFSPSFVLRAGYLATPIDLIKFNKINYNGTSPGSSKWETLGTHSSSTMGFFFEGHWASAGVASGLAYSPYTEVNGIGDKDENRIDRVNSKTSGSSSTAYLDYFFYRQAATSARRVHFGLGLSFSSHQLLFEVNELSVDDTPKGILFKAATSGQTTTLRIPWLVDWHFDSSIITIKGSVGIPIAFTTSTELSELSEQSLVNEESESLFEEAIDMQANPVGINIGISYGLVF